MLEPQNPPCEATADERLALAAAWYDANRLETSGRPLVPFLRRRFGLSAKEVCEVLVLARKIERAAA